MRTTIRIDDDLMADLKRQAQAEKTSLTRLINRLLRLSLQAAAQGRRKRRFRQPTYAMGQPRVELTKATARAALLEDEEILRKMSLRK